MDLSNAFDCLPRDLLKAKNCGLWIWDYKSYRVGLIQPCKTS